MNWRTLSPQKGYIILIHNQNRSTCLKESVFAGDVSCTSLSVATVIEKKKRKRKSKTVLILKMSRPRLTSHNFGQFQTHFYPIDTLKAQVFIFSNPWRTVTTPWRHLSTTPNQSSLVSNSTCAGCWNGMQSDLAPIEGAPGSRSASALLISLIWSSQSMSPQNGAWKRKKISKNNFGN